MSKATGIFGGAFAPFHNGHLRLVIEARERLGLDEVRLIPTAHPPHRNGSRVSPQRRLEWLKLGIRKVPGLVADDLELQRSGPSYTVDTLALLRKKRESASMILLMGADAFANLHLWRQWQNLLELAHIAVVSRPGATLNPSLECRTFLASRRGSPEQLLQQPAGLWTGLELPLLDISSTRIRRLLKAGQPVRGLVPDAILNDMTSADIAALTQDEDGKTH